MKLWNPISGTPQGSVLSPLLANVYLHQLDLTVHRSGFKMVRYADDWVVLCQSMEEAKDALSLIQSWINNNGLQLSPKKPTSETAFNPVMGLSF